ncbi:MAG: S8 family serine peptidase [Actinomycetota bacterium]|nr:S8 family serine peptidase [Actinomycetota bacterium]
MTPSPAPRRTSLVSPVLLAEADDISPAAKSAVLTNRAGGRVMLVELRVNPGTTVESARDQFRELFSSTFGAVADDLEPVPVGRHYMRCVLTPDQVSRLMLGGGEEGSAAQTRALELIYRIWPDLVVKAHLDRSLTTIQADAAARTYGCGGNGVVWAVIDSGIEASHPHFAASGTLTAATVKNLHRDFTITPGPAAGDPLVDEFGHGTHIAGIIAGRAPSDPAVVRVAATERGVGLPKWVGRSLDAGTSLNGVAPQAHLVSLKVLDSNGNTLESALLDAIEYIRTVNDGGRELQIHGLNMSLGCAWQPGDYAAGQSPLCRELDLLVSTGVVAVVSAGNIGAGTAAGGVGADVLGPTSDVFGQLSTITDPGNAATVITVGSTHRYRPHTFGVTFNSSKGPTLDGRLKPDLVAPGERITSAAASHQAAGVDPLDAGVDGLARYIEMDGTSMAAAHVSGAAAAFLSARPEFVGQPELVKKKFTDTATDLGRHQFYQGAGLINLMRALTST